MAKKKEIQEEEEVRARMPIFFSDILGQERIKKHLRDSARNDHLSHAYIVDGNKGMGKSGIAYSFAAMLQCESKGGFQACGTCESCRKALNYNNPNIITLHPDDKHPNTIGIEAVREQLVGDILLPPVGNRYKIYVIPADPPLNPQAQNALLKTLEEPPEYAVILILSRNSDSLLNTVRSRSIILKLSPVGRADISKYLQAKEGLDEGRANAYASFSGGNPGRARSLASDEVFERIKNNVVDFFSDGHEGMESLIETRKKVMEDKDRINDYLSLFLLMNRDILLARAGVSDAFSFIGDEAVIRAFAEKKTFEEIESAIEALKWAERALKAGMNAELVMEEALLSQGLRSREVMRSYG